MKRLFFLLLTTLLFSGCAPAEWQPLTLKTADICWPPEGDCKVRYAGEMHAFEQTSRSLISIIAGKSQSGRILKPVALATGPEEQMAIADQDRQGIHLFAPRNKNYKLLVLAGKERISTPVGVAFDDAGNLYVTDSQLNKILIYDAKGEFISTIDQAGGLPLLRPTGITFNRYDNRLYVAETLRHQILVFSRLGEFITRLGERGEQPGALNFPTHLASDREGNIYVTDSMNFRAQIFHPEKGVWSTFGHHGNGSGDFASPKGIGADANGIIYVAETLFDNVQMFDGTGTYLLAIGGQGGEAGQFWMPSGLFVDTGNHLYVCDTYNKRVQIFELLTGTVEVDKQRNGGTGK
ncbi:MAG: SBBP repeat-containing protein [Deltaproteobacteria bacterium]|nr:SBBP repeat-containing protein [Deltaproteobacteria bacterium]